jgi:hypothetical protein
MLFEYASEVLNPLGHAMPNDEFGRVFRDLLPILVSRTVRIKFYLRIKLLT